eukprot:scaffold16609_cov92-Isochrysis_galbana.AAC.1
MAGKSTLAVAARRPRQAAAGTRAAGGRTHAAAAGGGRNEVRRRRPAVRGGRPAMQPGGACGCRCNLHHHGVGDAAALLWPCDVDCLAGCRRTRRVVDLDPGPRLLPNRLDRGSLWPDDPACHSQRHVASHRLLAVARRRALVRPRVVGDDLVDHRQRRRHLLLRARQVELLEQLAGLARPVVSDFDLGSGRLTDPPHVLASRADDFGCDGLRQHVGDFGGGGGVGSLGWE